MKSDNFYQKAVWSAEEFLRYASPEARDKFLDKIQKQERENFEDVFEQHGVRCDLSVDWSNDVYCVGNGFVYCWANKTDGVFYIGCGSHGRVYNKHGRSEEFKRRLDGTEQAFVLMKRVDYKEALEIEKLCIRHAQVIGCNLVNKDHMMSESDIRKMRICLNEKEDLVNEELKNEFYWYEEEKYRLGEIVDALDKVVALQK